MSLSDVTFVLFCFAFAFVHAAALRSTIVRSSICMRPDNHTCVFIFLFLLLEMSPFLSILRHYYTVLSLYGEYVVARFLLPDGVFLPCDHGLDI